MKKFVVMLALAPAFLAVLSKPAEAADECRGLMTCIPVAGPWVVIPPSGSPPAASWRLRCPEGVVGGLDARLSERAVRVEFSGLIGSPVNPGITTANAAVFAGIYAGVARRPTSFKPYIGCIPGGGGQRTPTAYTAAKPVRPGRPITMRVRTLRLSSNSLARGTLSCREDERLLRAAHAVGIGTRGPPTIAQLAAVRVVRSTSGGRVLVSATRGVLAAGITAVVQVRAECAR